MILKFIGIDGDKGLRKGYLYDCEIRKTSDFVWLKCDAYNRRIMRTAYKSMDDLLIEWEAV